MGFALGEVVRQAALAVGALVESVRLAATGQLSRHGWRRPPDEGDLARQLRRVRAARRLRQRLSARER